MLRLFFLFVSIFSLFSCQKKEAVSESARASTEEQITLELEVPAYSLAAHEVLVKKFEEKHPSIKINTRVVYQNYEEGLERVLRASITDSLPDVSFQGFNRYRPLVESGIALPLNELIAAEEAEDFIEQGFDESVFSITTFGDKVYGLPFAVSLPVVYYNLDLIEQAGADRNNLPATWDEVIALAQKVDTLGDDISSMYLAWDISGNWLWQALIFSQGGSMMNAEETEVTFGDQHGRWALEKLYRMRSEAHQPDYSPQNAIAAFIAGKMGIYINSIAGLSTYQQQIGNKFVLKTGPFPEVNTQGKLPPGGNGSVLLTKDPQRQQAAWLLMKFWSGAAGAKAIVENTGYMSPNLAAVNSDLQQFYLDHPNHTAAIDQLSRMGVWYSFPGENGLKISNVIDDHIEKIMSGASDDVETVLKDMVAGTNTLLN